MHSDGAVLKVAHQCSKRASYDHCEYYLVELQMILSKTFHCAEDFWGFAEAVEAGSDL